MCNITLEQIIDRFFLLPLFYYSHENNRNHGQALAPIVY